MDTHPNRFPNLAMASRTGGGSSASGRGGRRGPKPKAAGQPLTREGPFVVRHRVRSPIETEVPTPTYVLRIALTFDPNRHSRALRLLNHLYGKATEFGIPFAALVADALERGGVDLGDEAEIQAEQQPAEVVLDINALGGDEL